MTNRLLIYDHRSSICCSFQFPRIIELAIESDLIRCADLDRMIIFSQLNTLAIQCDPLSLDTLLDFLHHAFNVRSLILYAKPRLPLPIEEMEKTCLISKNSKIIKLYVEAMCTLEYFHFFLNLCPRLERLDTGVRAHDIEFIVRDLLLTNTTTGGHLFSLRLWPRYNDETIKKLRTIIDNEKLLHDYSLECIHGAVHLWW